MGGYCIHITREGDWSDADAEPIELEEWVAYVESDPEMRSETLRLAVWTGHPDRETDGIEAGFRHHPNGEITVARPDTAIVVKAIRAARALGARVEGDEGEFYDELWLLDTLEKETKLVSELMKEAEKPWWKFW